jgi:hypothetical protein
MNRDMLDGCNAWEHQWPMSRMRNEMDSNASYRIALGDLPWEPAAPHASAKIVPLGSHRLRLLELRRGFVEDDWCGKGHTGYVLEGSLRVDFETGGLTLAAGDGLHIPAGPPHRHKALPLTERARLVLFEDT